MTGKLKFSVYWKIKCFIINAGSSRMDKSVNGKCLDQGKRLEVKNG